MAIHVLVPGADGRAWYWHRLVPELRARGHETVTMDLPDEDSAGLAEFADAICEAVQVTVGERAGQQRLVVVAQSLGGFSAPLVCGRLPVDELVLVNAMVPVSGESAGQWWENTGQPQARAAYAAASGRDPDAPFDVRADFFHDVPRELTEQAFAAQPPRRPLGALRRALAAAPVARGPDPVPPGPRGPFLPAGVPAPGGARAAGTGPRGAARRTPGRAQPSTGAR